MSPKLAFGPIDSAAQYLLYLSVVVLGVLLPVLVQKWRTRREKAQLLVRTLAALTAEVQANRKRAEASQTSFGQVAVLLQGQRELLNTRRASLLAGDAPAEPPQHPRDTHVNLPLLTHTAWDVARLADALVLLPSARLHAFARAYQMQTLFEQDRSLLLQSLVQMEVLELPLQGAGLAAVDARLEALVKALMVFKYFAGFAGGLLTVYDLALAANPPAPATSVTLLDPNT
jgi:hypothetical protein